MIMRLFCLALLLVTSLAWEAVAQTLTPPPGATYGQPLPVPPGRPLSYSPFMNYDLIYGYARGSLTAPQPIGHEHIPLGNNGYIYRPVYASPPMGPQAAMPTRPVPPQAMQPGLQPGLQPGAVPTSRPRTSASILRKFDEPPAPAPEPAPQAQNGGGQAPRQAPPAGPREF